jgi:hypothetical protein
MKMRRRSNKKWREKRKTKKNTNGGNEIDLGEEKKAVENTADEKSAKKNRRKDLSVWKCAPECSKQTRVIPSFQCCWKIECNLHENRSISTQANRTTLWATASTKWSEIFHVCEETLEQLQWLLRTFFFSSRFFFVRFFSESFLSSQHTNFRLSSSTSTHTHAATRWTSFLFSLQDLFSFSLLLSSNS